MTGLDQRREVIKPDVDVARPGLALIMRRSPVGAIASPSSGTAVVRLGHLAAGRKHSLLDGHQRGP